MELSKKRVILINGQKVVEELINGRIIVTLQRAMELSGRCASKHCNSLVPETFELLGHYIGWIWAIYFATNKQITHYSLIHADGETLSPDLATRIIEADKSVGGKLEQLQYLSPIIETTPDGAINEAREKYFNYLSKECGEIPLEGLPADQEVGSRRLNLDRIFIPLYLQQSTEQDQDNSLENPNKKEIQQTPERKLVGKILSNSNRLAILAAPGGGKTTLLKRLAIAYAFPERRATVNDNLPDRNWLPLFIRCRQLSSLPKSSILDIFNTIPSWAEMKDLSHPFSLLVSNALRDGQILLLIDGLDEISDERERITFVQQLRLFLSIYPTVGIIVTSREAGFRIVGGALCAYCDHYKLADFDNDDIKRLTLAWHREVVGDQDKVRLDAEKLAEIICKNERVRTLAKNPLLLTTLLLVKRWVGQLPSRRSVLYGKAIEVLLMTWNVEGYKPIEQDEAVPQLAFVAFAMMKDGVQRISLRRLKELLTLARKQMPDVLGYARISVSEFIDQVELRSSILVVSGSTIEQGTQYPMYEFRHLTFQEYLTARAIVDSYYPDRKDGETILSILKPYIKDPNWKEVIPLTAVLAGRKAQPLIQYLIEQCKSIVKPYRNERIIIVNQLTQCFLDEVQVAPDLLENGLEWIARRSSGPAPFVRELCNGRYRDVLSKVIRAAYLQFDEDAMDLGSAIGTVTLEELHWNNELTPEIKNGILVLLKSDSQIERIAGALATMEIAFYCRRASRLYKKTNVANKRALFKEIGNTLASLLSFQDLQSQLAAIWAFAWIGEMALWAPNTPDLLIRLLNIYRNSENSDIRYVVPWAISTLPLIDRTVDPSYKVDTELIDIIIKWNSINSGADYEILRRQRAALVMGFYLGKPWNDDQLAKLVTNSKNKTAWPNYRRIKKVIKSTQANRKQKRLI
jgi:hypothetical protein